MASTGGRVKAESKASSGSNSIEVFSWLKTLPLAPEYHPTLAEFQDPIAYIFKIEKEASKYGICKIVPPVSAPSKKTAISNLNRSLLARSNNSNPKSTPTFTTRQQQVGFCPRKHRPVKKPVWQSGESYTVPEFEAKAKLFEKNYLKKGIKRPLTALEVETLYWKATLDKPFSVEYANDMPGSAFVPLSGKKSKGTGEGVTVGETAWNMRGVSRSNGSLLKFMKEDIPGVTSPMVYLAMMFSWFAWHVEDHDLHSLNYMHMGAGKTWYGVPRDAAVAFEDVIRVHGYGGEINPIVTFATLGEKTTVMSPEVLLNAGVPCCRLVQNAGEFVVTFPRAYHSGFSHGFNCGEASNIATPEWLKLARDAAVRRASTNCPPMVSHVQLLYDLALSLSSRVPATSTPEPRSSRLKDKKKGEGETLVKELFVQDLVRNRELLCALGKGSPVVLLPRDSIDNSIQTKSRVGYPIKGKSDLSLGSSSTDGKMKVFSDLDNKQGDRGSNSMKGNLSEPHDGNRLPLFGGSNDGSCGPLSWNQNTDTEGERSAQCDRLPNKGLISCVTCGILCFACVAIIKPTEVASHNLMSSNCSNFSDWNDGSKVHTERLTRLSGNANTAGLNSGLGWMLKSTRSALVDVPRESLERGQRATTDGSRGLNFNTEIQMDNSSLGLLALTYGGTSDSEEDQIEAPVNAKKPESKNFSAVDRLDSDDSGSPSHNHHNGASGRCIISFPLRSCDDEVPLQTINSCEDRRLAGASFEDNYYQSSDCSFEFQTNNNIIMEANSSEGRSCHLANDAKQLSGSALIPIEDRTMPFGPIADEDSSRLHVFCLQHAAEVEQQLHSVGGMHLLLLCHPDYPKLQAEAKLMADELGLDHLWSDIEFRDATDEDKETINSALESEECIHGNGDWAVKLGINLYYSANLSRSPLYSKQIPYNTVIYGAFGCSASSDEPAKAKVYEKGSGKHKKIVVAGKWCGKVWMSNQVHPLLAGRDDDDEQEQKRGFQPLPAPVHPRSSLKLQKPSKSQTTDLASLSSKIGNKRKNTDDGNGDGDGDDDDVERERERGFLALPAPELPKSSKKPSKNHTTDVASQNSKIGRKRKNTNSRSASRAKSLKIEEPVRALDDAPDTKFIRQYKRNFRNKRKKEIKETPQPRDNYDQQTKQSSSFTEDEPEGGPSTRLRKRTSLPPTGHRAKLVGEKFVSNKQTGNAKAKKASACHSNKNSSDEEGEYACNMEEKIVSKKRTSHTKAKKASACHSNRNSSDEEAEYACNMEEKIVSKKRTSNSKAKKASASHRNTNSSDEEAEYACNMEEKFVSKKRPGNAKAKKASASRSNKNSSDEEAEYACDMEGCTMSFKSERELMLHKENICPVKGCGKSFFSHKYLVQHRRVHVDDRPLKCPWKGCEMTFKWAWARTEHVRVHTGARPYICNVAGCGQTFRFVSDFSRHKRKTGHSTKKVKKQI